MIQTQQGVLAGPRRPHCQPALPAVAGGPGGTHHRGHREGMCASVAERIGSWTSDQKVVDLNLGRV